MFRGAALRLLMPITTFRVQMTFQVAVYIRCVAAEFAAEVTRRLTAFVLQMTFQAVLPFVVAVAVAAHPRFLDIGIIDHVL